MDIILSNSSGKPIYEQIADQVKEQILAGALSAGDALPSMRVLAKELRISVITTKRAYEELERDGFLDNVPGKGCFVAPQNRELLREAQLRRVQRFSAPLERRQFVCGDLVLDREEFSVTAGGEPVVLTAREFEILALLMEYPKRVFTREQIYQHVWGEEYFGDDNTVNVHVSNLRSKLGRVSDREYIKTVWGIGFKMAEP